MKQFTVDESKKIEVDYNDNEIPESVRILKPLLFLEESEGELRAYCVVLGPDPQAGIFGCGDTPNEALQDWDNHLQEFKSQHEAGDEVAAYIDQVYEKQNMPFETPNVKGLS
jgi:hypothetical protein